MLAVLIGIFVVIPVLFFVVVGIFSAVANSGNEPVRLRNESILKIELKGTLVEDASPTSAGFDLSRFLPFSGDVSTEKMGLYQIIQSLEAASEEEKISGLYLNLNPFLQTGWANLKSIREALVDFQASGKFIYAYAEIYTEKSYYLASVADEVFMPAEGRIEFNGFASTPMFYTGLFEKAGIEPLIFRVGSFKSATEPYSRKSMSPESRAQTSTLLDDLWLNFAEDVSRARGLTMSQLNQLAEEFVIGDGAEAVRVGLIEEHLYEEEVLEKMLREVKAEEVDDLPLVPFRKYLLSPKTRGKASQGKIAVIFAEGVIQGGKSGSGVIGSESMLKTLKRVREDKKIKAVVLRVNSPGGTQLASDLIAREIAACTKVKTVVTSMGDYAASGGYYISAPSDRIFAEASTITGSIGVYSILFDTRKLFNEKLGLTFDEVETHSYANFGNPFYEMSAAEKALFKAQTNKAYSSFIHIVREGRGFTDSLAVDKIGQGRVWSGEAAKRINLVDEIGGLEAALAYAAEQAGLGDEYRVVRFSAPQDPFEELLAELQESSQLDMEALREELLLIYEVKRHFPQSGTYALMPYRLEVR
jgi:protease-4